MISLDRVVDLEEHGCYIETFPLVLDDAREQTKVVWTYSIEWKVRLLKRSDFVASTLTKPNRNCNQGGSDR